jgi:hypothetical protein
MNELGFVSEVRQQQDNAVGFLVVQHASNDVVVSVVSSGLKGGHFCARRGPARAAQRAAEGGPAEQRYAA